MKKVIIVLAIIVFVILLATRNKNTDQDVDVIVDETMQEDVDMIQDESLDMMSETTSGRYEAFANEKLAFANEGDVVLFFRASWCPSCKALDDNIKANLSNIPENLLILDTDYDSSNELKQKYGVTTQHTLVQVDATGEMIQKWSGGSTLDSIIANL
jgi:thiol-disulfide isomerase/thioredoxin